MGSRIRSALVWTAAFAFAVALFFLVSKWLRVLPPTEPVAVGRVTVEKASKLRDYTTHALFYLLVPLGTFGLAAGFRRFLGRFAPKGLELLTALLFAIPFWFAPFFYLTTRKEGWTAILAPALAAILVFTLRAWSEQRSLRELFRPPLGVTHALLIAEGVSWLVFRYVATGKRIAHFDTLFLEVLFLLFFIIVYWTAAALISAAAARIRGERVEEVFPRFALGAAPLLLLAPLGLVNLAAAPVAAVIFAIAVAGILLAISRRFSPSPARVRTILAWVVIPLLLFSINVGSGASPWQWTDLFHRGESLGPASDYLRGKVPYRDVFVLHGLLDDGLLDAGLMEIFGRDQRVGVWRLIVLDSAGLVAVWMLSFAAFNSIPMAAVSLAIALVTSVGNQRVVMEILSALFLIAAIRTGRKWLMLGSGIFAALAIFYSLETGIYSVIGAAATLAALALVRSRRAGEVALNLAAAAAIFAAGLIIGAAPFLAWLGSRGVIGAFFETSFLTVPSIIDAVWSVPFPKLGMTFRDDPSLRSVSQFVLGEGLRFLLNPLVLGLALLLLIVRFFRRTMSGTDLVLVALTMCGIISQRSALGRADFPHQYFSAFLIGPVIAVLLAELFAQLRASARAGEEGKAFAGLAVMALAPVVFISLWVPDLMNARINDLASYRARISGAGADPVFGEVLERVNAIRDEVSKIVPRGKPVFDFSNQPALYFFADRPNPTRFYQIPILSPPRFQREVILQLDRSRPKVVFRRSPADFDVFDGITNEMRAPALAAYLDRNYAFFRSVRGVELWRRRGEVTPLPVERYLALHKVPTPEQVAESRRERLIFPAVASIEGIAGSNWRTDLTIFNPHEIPVRVRLRYSSQSRPERDVTIPPRSVGNFEDVVSSMFHSRGTQGALLIDVPALHPVTALAKTWDAGRGGRSSQVQPMTIADAASAKGEKRALVMTGFPSGGRLNIGVMNVGRAPARFAISALHNEGWPASPIVIRSGALEQESYFLGQAEQRLGVTVDRNLIIRIEAEQGEIIAYASVVDAETSDSTVIPAVPVR